MRGFLGSLLASSSPCHFVVRVVRVAPWCPWRQIPSIPPGPKFGSLGASFSAPASSPNSTPLTPRPKSARCARPSPPHFIFIHHTVPFYLYFINRSAELSITAYPTALSCLIRLFTRLVALFDTCDRDFPDRGPRHLPNRRPDFRCVSRASSCRFRISTRLINTEIR